MRRAWNAAARAVRGLAFFAVSALALGADLQIHFVPPGTRVEDLAKLPPPTVSVDELVDSGDFYTMAGGAKVPLLRAKNSVAVRFASAVGPERGKASLRARRELPDHEEVARAEFRRDGSFHILRARAKAAALDPVAVQADASVEYARPVFVDVKSKMRMIATDEVLARFAARTTAAEARAAVASAGLQIVGRSGGSLNVFRLRLRHPKTGDPLRAARVLAAKPGVRWAQPNFLREIRHSYTPTNPLFGDQQALRNTGQNHGVAGADVDAVHAWDTTTGSSSIVIAIIDDAVDIAHPGLRIFTNPGESGGGKETNATDDDGNGLVDDVHGWDFANNDKNPGAVGTNGHGTATAGIAGATFGTQARAAGIAGGCTILPVKIADDTGAFSTDQIIGTAIVYAAHYADVLSNSWGGGSESSYINDAIDYATTQGRGGKGCPVFFATGNYASTWFQGGGRFRLSTAGLVGNFYYSFYFKKSGTMSAGENAVRIDNVCLLDGDGYTHKTAVLADEDFEDWFYIPGVINYPPNGWWLSTSGTASGHWTPTTTNAFTGTGGSLSAVSPALTNGQYAWLLSPQMALSGTETFAFAASISTPDDAALYIPVYNGSFAFVGYYGPFSGLPDYVSTDTTYPASYANSIAVGASTDCDLRSDYSEYGGHIDVVAPSNGGWNDIAALDPLGAVGWTPDDYKMNFGGTSAATPLAAGIAALALSVNPSLTAAEIRTLLHITSDKIGGVTYAANGTHPMYGYGRVNARKAVASAMPSIGLADAAITEGVPGTTGTAMFNVTLSAPAVRPVTVQFGTANGTAFAGRNYLAASATLTIQAGSTAAAVPVVVNGGTLLKPTGTFFLNLSNAASATIARVQATGTISMTDTDGDGLPDYWENAHGLNPNNPSDAALDADGDGFTNLQEFLAGTDPHDPASRMFASDLSPDGGDLRITFKTATGRNYRVEYKNNLTDAAWLPLGSDVTGTGGVVQVTDQGALTAQQTRFYRITVVP